MLTRKYFLLATLALLSMTSSLLAEVKLASPFTSHMVLQREMKVPVWGTAAPSEKVTVEFAGQKKSIVAAADGKWRVTLNAMKASLEGRTLTVTGSHTGQLIQLDDVLVGEVWLASGQSNMDFSVSKKVKYFAGVTNEEQEIAAANYPLIRMFTGKSAKTDEPQSSVNSEWRVCSPETVPAFSAVGYFFARDLHQELKVPVGIVTLAFGASTAEAWIRRETLAADPQLKPMLDRFDAACQAFKATGADPEKLKAEEQAHEAEDAQARAEGRPPPRRPRNPDRVQDQHNATVLFNGMINPVIPYA